MKLDPYHTPYTKTNSKTDRRLKVRPETAKLLEENLRESSITFGLGKEFLDRTPKA